MKTLGVATCLLALGCVPRPYAEFERAMRDPTVEDLRILDRSGAEGGLLLISLLETDFTWTLVDQGEDKDPLVRVEEVGTQKAWVVPGFERFSGTKPKKVDLVLSNPSVVVWAMRRSRR